MLGVGQKFPEFKLKAVVSNDIKTGFKDLSNKDLKGKWTVMFFYPKDFTFVCPTEIKGFGDLHSQYKERNTEILGVSVDSEFVHLAWRQSHDDLKNLPFPLVSDIKRELSQALGILDPEEGVSQRATFVIDPDGIIRFVYVTDLSVGRNPKEVLRIVDGLQTDELCPCNWEKGQETIHV